ncbi:acylneuraminate cytidylyltransferase [Glaciihabitans arcticus]|uniref:Acylneuraminate cytidylyltransferase n=1 Tax=Glaciihabitans arcticus TaxID=2668039 RepID=A0A4Q9GQV8_9MICO|nr:glycosyltransferase family protein [Glaciihabitans arcticus]TBN55968.1 acylneuraminate cytidylyltransferase [Glaciihabitans arcticus]
MSTVCVVQARYSSSRLPGKVLERIGDSSMIERVLERLSRSSQLDEIVVATTDQPADVAVAAAVEAAGFRVIRGAQYDVLERYLQAVSDRDDADVVVRVTADCPFIDPDIVDRVIAFRTEGDLDFAANRLPPPHARTYPVGLDVEVATVVALRRAGAEATAPHHREHVMPYLYESGDRFRFGVVQLDEDLSGYRWTVDTPEDLAAARAIAELVGPEPFGWRDVLEVARMHPEIARINGSLAQKDVTVVDTRWTTGPTA